MASLMNKVDEKINDLILSIKESSEYKRYFLLAKRLEENELIKNLIGKIKTTQKKIVNKEDVSKQQGLLENLNRELKSIPLYQEYLNAVANLNSSIGAVTSIISNYIDAEILESI